MYKMKLIYRLMINIWWNLSASKSHHKSGKVESVDIDSTKQLDSARLWGYALRRHRLKRGRWDWRVCKLQQPWRNEGQSQSLCQKKSTKLVPRLDQFCSHKSHTSRRWRLSSKQCRALKANLAVGLRTENWRRPPKCWRKSSSPWCCWASFAWNPIAWKSVRRLRPSQSPKGHPLIRPSNNWCVAPASASHWKPTQHPNDEPPSFPHGPRETGTWIKRRRDFKQKTGQFPLKTLIEDGDTNWEIGRNSDNSATLWRKIQQTIKQWVPKAPTQFKQSKLSLWAGTVSHKEEKGRKGRWKKALATFDASARSSSKPSSVHRALARKGTLTLVQYTRLKPWRSRPASSLITMSGLMWAAMTWLTTAASMNTLAVSSVSAALWLKSKVTRDKVKFDDTRWRSTPKAVRSMSPKVPDL